MPVQAAGVAVPTELFLKMASYAASDLTDMLLTARLML